MEAMSKFAALDLTLTRTSLLSTVLSADQVDREDDGETCEPRQCASDFKLTPSGGDFGFVDTSSDTRPGTGE